MTAALIVVDMQNDFGHPNGSLYVKGAEDVLEAVNACVTMSLALGAVIIYTQDWHPEHTPHFIDGGGPWPSHCVAETWGAALLDGLDVAPHAIRIRKGVNGEDGYSGFTVRDAEGNESSTGLHETLQKTGITHVDVVGLATDYCVKATAIDAAKLGYNTTVFTDAVAAVNLNEGDEKAALDEMINAGVQLL